MLTGMMCMLVYMYVQVCVCVCECDVSLRARCVAGVCTSVKSSSRASLFSRCYVVT